jgi:hypothetical protein
MFPLHVLTERVKFSLKAMLTLRKITPTIDHHSARGGGWGGGVRSGGGVGVRTLTSHLHFMFAIREKDSSGMSGMQGNRNNTKWSGIATIKRDLIS